MLGIVVKIDDDDPRIARWAAIAELAISECGSQEPASRWMRMPKIALVEDATRGHDLGGGG
jgi:hypothetical protein